MALSTNKEALKLGLKTKLTALVISAVVFVALVLGMYFDNTLQSHFRGHAQEQIDHGFNRLLFSLSNIEQQLSEGISFVQTNEKLLASVELINHYQNKKNYNTFLIDEEKKALAEELLNRLKAGLNQDASLYDQDGELIALARLGKDHSERAFVSFSTSVPVLWSSIRQSDPYAITTLPEGSITLQHKNFYAPGQPTQRSVLTYHRLGNALAIKSHLHLYRQDSGKVLGHIEMTRVLDTAYFEKLSKDFGIRLGFAFSSESADKGQKLGDDLLMPEIQLITAEHTLSGLLKKKLVEGEVFFTASLDRTDVDNLLKHSRLQLFLLLVGVIVLTLLIAQRVINRMIERPLDALKLQLNKVAQHDYSQSSAVPTRDELQEVSMVINNLANAVSLREDELSSYHIHLENLVKARTAELQDALVKGLFVV